MKFKSSTGEPIQLSTINGGHTVVVGVEPTEIPAIFNRIAISKGCIPVGIETPEPEPNTEPFDRKKAIAEAIKAMLDGSDEKDFTANGKPNMTRLNARLGFTADRSEVDSIFEELANA